MTVTKSTSVGTAAFTPENPGDEILDAVFQRLKSAKDSNPWVASFTDGSLDEAMAGANQLTMTLLDKDLAELRGGAFNGSYDVLLDGVPFRLSTVDKVDVDLINLVFEHRIIAKLRDHDTRLKVNRDSTTRAQFIYRMVAEVNDEEINFVSPEIAIKQPVAAAKISRTPKPVPGKAPGFTPGAKLNVKGTPASQHQLDEAATLLAECVSLGTSTKVMQAIICAGIQESALGAAPDTYRPSTFDGVGTWGVLQVGSGQGSGANSGLGPHDTQAMAHYFCIGGKGMMGGGAIAVAKTYPGIPPGDIARRVENPGSSAGPYMQWQHEAAVIVQAYTGAAAPYSGDPGVGGGAQMYEFYRGQPGQPEDSWTCIQRLANEVQWRAFVAGQHSLYYVADRDLMQQQPRYLIDRETVGVHDITYTMEVGRRMVVVKGKRIAKPSEAIMMVRIDRWDAPPGTVIELADWGPADGRWLVNEVTRPLFDALATVRLHQPQDPLPEPAPQAVGSSGLVTPGGFVVSQTTGAAKAGSKGNLLGTLAGGDTFTWERYDQGQDVAIKPAGNPIYANGNGTVTIHHNPGGFGPNYCSVKYTTGPFAGAEVYYGHCPPVVADGSRVSAGSAIAHTGTASDIAAGRTGNASTPGWLEIGFWPVGPMGVGIAMARKLGNPSPHP